MEPTQTLGPSGTIVAALAWGALLAYYSWHLVALTVHHLVDRVTRTGKTPRHGTALVLALGKWLGYAGWLYVGLVWARLSPWALALGFFVGWALGIGPYARRAAAPCDTETGGAGTLEVPHGTV